MYYINNIIINNMYSLILIIDHIITTSKKTTFRHQNTITRLEKSLIVNKL